MKNGVMEEVKRIFKPEFLNRLDETVIYRPLTRENIRAILGLLTADISRRLSDRRISLTLSEAACDHIADQAYDPAYGARPLKRYLQSSVENLLARKIIGGEIGNDSAVLVDAAEGELIISSERV